MRWIIPMVTGIWAFWKWMDEQKKEHANKRMRNLALYVNPFLSACEDLQSRIYNILEQ